jgi:hypothetical protein
MKSKRDFFNQIYIFILILVSLIGASCSHVKEDPLRRQMITDGNSPNDGVNFQLSPLPSWANFSTNVKCQRSLTPRYLDYSKLVRLLGFNYEESMSFQYYFNVQVAEFEKNLKNQTEKLMSSPSSRPQDLSGGAIKSNQFFNASKNDKNFIQSADPFVSSRDLSVNQSIWEEKLFLDSKEFIKAKRRLVKLPTAPTISILWVDEWLVNSQDNSQNKNININKEKYLKKLDEIILGAVGENTPIMILSTCLNYHELKQLIIERKWDKVITEFLSYETFSIYDNKGVAQNNYSLLLFELFSPQQKIHWYSPKGNIPSTFDFGKLQKNMKIHSLNF